MLFFWPHSQIRTHKRVFWVQNIINKALCSTGCLKTSQFKHDSAEGMLTDPPNECSRAGFTSRTALQMIKYPTKLEEVFFCNIRFHHPSTWSGSHGDLHPRRWIHHASAVRWDHWCTETSFSRIIKLLNTTSFLRGRPHECNDSLIYGWGIKRRTPTHVCVENRHHFNRIGDISAWYECELVLWRVAAVRWWESLRLERICRLSFALCTWVGVADWHCFFC